MHSIQTKDLMMTLESKTTELTIFDWVSVVMSEPESIKDAPVDDFTGFCWAMLWMEVPSLFDVAYSVKLTPLDKARLLEEQPQFVKSLDMTDLDSLELAIVLNSQPQLASIVDDILLRKLTKEDCIYLAINNPRFKDFDFYKDAVFS